MTVTLFKEAPGEAIHLLKYYHYSWIMLYTFTNSLRKVAYCCASGHLPLLQFPYLCFYFSFSYLHWFIHPTNGYGTRHGKCSPSTQDTLNPERAVPGLPKNQEMRRVGFCVIRLSFEVRGSFIKWSLVYMDTLSLRRKVAACGLIIHASSP